MNELKRILVIDDEPIVRATVNRILSKEIGYDVTLAENGKNGIERFKNENYDLILLDIKMPDIDGLDVLHEIVSYNPNQTVIIISGFYTEETKEEAQKKGVFAFIEKPFTPFQLLEIVKKAI